MQPVTRKGSFSPACSVAALVAALLQIASVANAYVTGMEARGRGVFAAPSGDGFDGFDVGDGDGGDGDGPAEAPMTFNPANYDDYTEDVPTAQYDVRGGCDTYDATSVDWQAVRDDIVGYLSQGGGGLGPDGISYSRVAPMLLRTSFHDAGAHGSGRGGADGSCMLSGDEQDWPANTFPLKFMPYVRGALWRFVDKYQISWADAIAVGGIAGAQYLGAPSGFTIRVGRCDNPDTNPEALPSATLDYTAFVEYWQGVGIGVRHAAALMGSHSAIEDGHGGDPVTWSNSLYVAQTSPGAITVTDPEGAEGADSVAWDNGVWKYTVNDANTAPQNIAPNCPFQAQFIRAVQTYAASEDAWFFDFTRGYKKMTEIGAAWSPSSTVVRL